MRRPIGYFAHHQGRGHAELCGAIAAALPSDQPLRIFCARDDLFPPLPPNAVIERIPSLFEATGDEAPGLRHLATPDTVHCAPVGWPGIRIAMARIAAWFGEADPALMICDVSAEIAQLARLCSVPHVAVLQHGDRGDLGHCAAYDGAIGLLAPFHASLAQPEWDAAFLAKTCFAGGLGVDTRAIDRDAARRRIGIARDEQVVLVMSGGGGRGFAQAPIAVGARSFPHQRWITIGTVERDWHATEPGNLEHRGWVETAAEHIAAADLVVASTGNTTCQQILAAGRPWLAVPEWRYFDEQHRKAAALAAVGAASVRPHLPSSPLQWRAAVEETLAAHDGARQTALVEPEPARKAVAWIEALIERAWARPPANVVKLGAAVS